MFLWENRKQKAIYDATRQELPGEFQKYFIDMIRSAQKPLYYDGFGLVIVNLETFAKVNGCFFMFEGTYHEFGRFLFLATQNCLHILHDV